MIDTRLRRDISPICSGGHPILVFDVVVGGRLYEEGAQIHADTEDHIEVGVENNVLRCLTEDEGRLLAGRLVEVAIDEGWGPVKGGSWDLGRS